MARFPLCAAVITAGAITTACGTDVTSAATERPPGADLVVVADDMRFQPERIEVPGGATVELHLDNHGGVVHDLVLADGWESGDVRPGEAVTLTFGPLEATTVAWCSVPGHRDAGMELTVDVVDDP